MQIATVTQFASKLTEKGATRSSVMMSKRMPSGSTELKEMPRRPGYAEGAEGDVEWCKAVDAASAGYGKSNRAQSTANEHDLYAWSFNQYAIRQGFGSFLERCGKEERAPKSSGTGRLKPTCDDKGAMRVAPQQLVLAWLLDLGSGSSETPKGGHPGDEPWQLGAAAVSSRRASFAHLARGWRPGDEWQPAGAGLLVAVGRATLIWPMGGGQVMSGTAVAACGHGAARSLRAWGCSCTRGQLAPRVTA